MQKVPVHTLYGQSIRCAPAHAAPAEPCACSVSHAQAGRCEQCAGCHTRHAPACSPHTCCGARTDQHAPRAPRTRGSARRPRRARQQRGGTRVCPALALALNRARHAGQGHSASQKMYSGTRRKKRGMTALNSAPGRARLPSTNAKLPSMDAPSSVSCVRLWYTKSSPPAAAPAARVRPPCTLYPHPELSPSRQLLQSVSWTTSRPSPPAGMPVNAPSLAMRESQRQGRRGRDSACARPGRARPTRPPAASARGGAVLARAGSCEGPGRARGPRLAAASGTGQSRPRRGPRW